MGKDREKIIPVNCVKYRTLAGLTNGLVYGLFPDSQIINDTEGQCLLQPQTDLGGDSNCAAKGCRQKIKVIEINVGRNPKVAPY